MIQPYDARQHPLLSFNDGRKLVNFTTHRFQELGAYVPENLASDKALFIWVIAGEMKEALFVSRDTRFLESVVRLYVNPNGTEVMRFIGPAQFEVNE